jgi:uncharacterized protein
VARGRCWGYSVPARPLEIGRGGVLHAHRPFRGSTNSKGLIAPPLCNAPQEEGASASAATSETEARQVNFPLWDAVLARSTNRHSPLHGPDHWRRVSTVAGNIATSSGGSGAVGEAFGVLHDAMRVNDGHDPDHGRRASQLASELRHLLGLSDREFGLLTRACDLHADGLTDPDPTIGACWDADRLDLARLGIRPDPRFLSTAVARARVDAGTR